MVEDLSHQHEVPEMRSVDLGSFLGILFQLTVSPFIEMDHIIEDVGEKVGRMLSAEASRSRALEGQDEQGEGLSKKYLWWSPSAAMGRTTDPVDRGEESTGVFEGKTRSCEDANSADLNREVCLHSKYLYVWAGRGEKGDNGDWARGLKMGQLTLSMGPAGAEVCSYIQRATILSKRVIPYIKYS
jgi:hypothetical protein